MNDSHCDINIPGYFDRGDCSLLCRPTAWYDIIVFFLGNYVAHIATVYHLPGQSPLLTVATLAIVLLFPGAGVMRSIDAIKSMAIFAPTELQTAARAGALCMVTRKTNGRGIIPPPRKEPPLIRSTRIHGRYKLPDGWDFTVVPRNATFQSDPDKECFFKRYLSQTRNVATTSVSCSYSWIKILASIGQLIFGIVTLYRTRGDQLSQYGYAAFGLTVSQYAWMSLLNLIGNLLCPQYPTMYVVESFALDELRQIWSPNDPEPLFFVEGTVGRISRDAEGVEENLSHSVLLFISILLATAPLVIIGALSKYREGESEKYQRVWVMMWLVFGMYIGPYALQYLELDIEFWPTLNNPIRSWRPPLRYDIRTTWRRSLSFGYLAYGIPAVGGFLVVAQMLQEFGVCFELKKVTDL